MLTVSVFSLSDLKSERFRVSAQGSFVHISLIAEAGVSYLTGFWGNQFQKTGILFLVQNLTGKGEQKSVK